MSELRPDWLRDARGSTPTQRWSYAADAPLADLQLARESGEILIADTSGGLYLLDRLGRLQSLIRLSETPSRVAQSDDGEAAVVVLDDRTIAWFERPLQLAWTRELPDAILGVAMAPFGTHVAVGLADGTNAIYTSANKRLCKFESVRPLRHLRFLVTEPELVAAAEYGYLARYDLRGEVAWSQTLWSTIGDLAVTGDGKFNYLAGYAHGIQVFNDGGTATGSWVLEGTASLVSTTYRKDGLAAATLERHLARLGADGSLRWLATAPEDVLALRIFPLGESLICGFRSGRVVRLDEAV